jgi:hypothetical protein
MTSSTFDREYLVEKFEHAGRTVKIFRDPEPMSPRDYDNWSTLACWHRRLVLGDEEKRIEPMSLETLREKIAAEGDEILAVLALYLYDHSGITMRAGDANPFHDRWDSGQVGWGYVTRSNVEKMMGGAESGASVPTAEELTRYIRQEVEAYDEYLTGQVYGYSVKGREGETLDDCWGFYGGLEYVRGEAKEAAENSDDPADARDVAEMAARATYAGPAAEVSP